MAARQWPCRKWTFYFLIWNKPIADPLAAIVVATIIASNAIGLFRENLSFLLGRSPGPELLANINNLALSVEGVVGVHDLRAEYIGPGIVHAGIHIEVQSGLTIDEANRIAEEVDRWIHQGIPSGYCVIHVDATKQLELYENKEMTE